ncbi:MAG: DUF1254 domain-containing protein, partial [Deltaproteobacteria bacterium]|nr:DUF1254 domain-containing protein [Deltaproteobacteria bacterium]
MRIITISTFAAVLLGSLLSSGVSGAGVTPDEARVIAKEAYIYGFPVVDNYRIMFDYFVNKGSPEYKGPINTIWNSAQVYGPQDKTIQTPNSDTPYSFAWLDLRAEPMVLTLPAIDKGRYYSVQLIDAYTYNFDYLGTRTTGNDGGSFLVVGPNWKGEAAKGIKKVLRADTQFVLALYRTQLFDPGDLDNVKRIQAAYKVQRLSEFLTQPAPKAAAAVNFVKALTPEEEKTSLDFFPILNFVLQFCPALPSEKHLMSRFAQIGVGAGKAFSSANLSPELRSAIEGGRADAWQAFAELQKQIDAGKVTAGDLFGTRQYMKNNYLYRFAGAVLGIYGNSKQEALYPVYFVDSSGQPLNASKRGYQLRFAKGQLPPVNAFWSLTMYNLPQRLLVANPLNRYLINSAMLPDLKRDADGGLALYIQHDSPGAEKESNWLPAPDGPF